MLMRLTARQRLVIRKAGLGHFGVVPWLFDLGLDDAGRGRGIDWYMKRWSLVPHR